ncbi:MAG: hypothetical protein JWQ43_2941 [Glaciihabitans sp.]|nr:hypothetical protein [Glaciihabitans sp.]
MTIDWMAFVVVLVAALLSACAVVTLYSVGLRLVEAERGWRHSTGIACFVICAALVLFGVYLVIPLFH